LRVIVVDISETKRAKITTEGPVDEELVGDEKEDVERGRRAAVPVEFGW
jgi:hypothetical protein